MKLLDYRKLKNQLIAAMILGLGCSLALLMIMLGTAPTQAFSWFDSEKEPAVAEASISDDTPLTIGLFRKLSAQESPTVVNIRTTKTMKRTIMRREPTPMDDFFGDDFWRRFFGVPEAMKMQSLGSGVIIDDEGYILTNNHVVEGMDDITVSTHDGSEYEAEIIGTDKISDLALIRAKSMKDFKVARIGDSDLLAVGDWVMAIGNPFGYGHTLTVGIVSALGRTLSGGDRDYSDLIQTDASINPGNSGGPLFNIQGELVGIATAIAARVEQSAGIGFAIPINLAHQLVPQLKEKGSVTRGWLGVYIQEITKSLAESLGLGSTKGAMVSSVEQGSPAEEAGIQREDVIVKVDGTPIDSTRSLQRVVAFTEVGKRVAVEVIRNGKRKTLEVTIGKRLDSADESEVPAATEDEELKLGITVQNINSEISKLYGLSTGEGVVIVEVESGSVADDAGLRQGDIILEINREKIQTVTQVRKILNALNDGDSLVLYIRRGKASLYIAIKMEPQ